MTTSPGMKSSRITLERVAVTETDQAFVKMNDSANELGIYTNSGNPEGVVTANRGSVCYDTTSGGIGYLKTTASGNTGWESIARITGDISWTPTVKNPSFGGTGTYTIQSGRYWRVKSGLGNIGIVIASGSMTWTSHTNPGNGTRIDLPVIDQVPLASISANVIPQNFVMPASTVDVTLRTVGSAQADLIATRDGTTASPIPLVNAGTLDFTMIYMTATG